MRRAQRHCAGVGGAVIALLWSALALADIRVVDDAGQTLTLPAPARRIISLAPHATENLFAAGAGQYLVAVSDFSDYPPAAMQIRSIGGSSGLDLESILMLKPDLVIAWQSGNPREQVARLMQLGVPVFLSEPRRLEDIATMIEQLGELAGTREISRPVAQQLRRRITQLRARYANSVPIGVFYQLWDHPLMTIGGAHLISDAIALCGGRNVFADLTTPAPAVDWEAAVRRDPQVIVLSSGETRDDDWVDQWRRWPEVRAVKNQHIVSIPADLINRHTPRMLDAVEQLCSAVDAARR